MKRKLYNNSKRWLLLVFLSLGFIISLPQLASADPVAEGNNDSDLIGQDLQQQQIEVTGTVTEAETGNPLPGVNIVIQGTTRGTTTDMDGNYTIEAPEDATLVYSFVGYESQTIPVNGRREINVTLEQSSMQLEEVVAIGYGSAKRKDLTSSISTVNSEDIDKTPSADALQSLQGKVSGVEIVSSGAPGTSPTVRVRGIGSYPGRGNESPLYVVDGAFYDNIDFLNTSEIESMSVLKSASAAAIYGVRAANGVIVIETKSGEFDRETQITYDGYYGVQVAQDVLKMANAEQYTKMAMASGSAADSLYILNAMQRYGRSRKNPNVPDVNTDWYDEILRPGPMQNHSLTISGGTEKSSYSIGTSYFTQKGILDMKNNYQRFNLRSKVDHQAKDWLTIGGNVMFSDAQRYAPANSAWRRAYHAVPIFPAYDNQNEDAEPLQLGAADMLGYRGGQNPLAATEFNENQILTRKMLANFYAEVEIIPEQLTFKTTYNYTYSSFQGENVGLSYYVTENMQRENSTLNKYTNVISDKIWDNTLTYDNSFDNHNLRVMLGSSFRDESFQRLAAGGLNFPEEQRNAWYLDKADEINEDAVGDGGSRLYGLSYFGRVQYNYQNKYYIYGTMRADGTQKYQEKWGYFPSLGVGWSISQEDFMQNVDPINFLKLRASWGQLGNDKIRPSAGTATTNVVNTAIDGSLVSGTQRTSTYSVLEWELVEEFDVGVTATLFDNRMDIDFDYFIRDTKNAAIDVQRPLLGGSTLKNQGEIRNQGVELSMNWSDNINDNWSYRVGGNLSTLNNEVLNLFGQPYLNGGSAEFRQRSIPGEPLLAFYGWEVAGVYQNQTEIQNDPIAQNNGLVPGDFKYVDQNGDEAIDAEDRVVLGSYFPDFKYGFNLQVSYKNLSLSADFMGKMGNKILNRKRGEIIWTADLNKDAELATNLWDGEGSTNKYPSASGLRRGWNQKMSDYFVEDGSYFRIRNVQLSYTIKDQTLMGVQMPETRIYATAERLLTISDYNGFSNEVSNGIDDFMYPTPAVYNIGVNVKF
ncbi:MAG: TonB-dependent receptor [Bacteroidales bacterium]|nr:TonB-dependent receptor [Bacteroidales bacterium]